ncbi:hypothetical protein LSAT2_032515 [Lamellibrachia satsuma]|nr:hypothetical protein LSAT2_032515 [Lamellibrachia satsuma]
MAHVPQKIVLKNTTKMSLNERFTTVQRTVPVQQVRATFQAQTQASAKNRRLAQQMANRLSLVPVPPQQTKPRSLKQRLGTNVKARLNLTQRGFARGNFRGRTRGRLMSRGRGGLVPRSSSTSLVSSASDSALYTTSRGRVRGVFRGIRGRFQRGRALGTTAGRARGTSRGRGVRGSFSGRFPRKSVSVGDRQGQPFVPQYKFRGGRGAIGAGQSLRGRSRGRGAWGRGQGKPVSREQLDADLDVYMNQGDN